MSTTLSSLLAGLAQRFHQFTGLKLGALDETMPPPGPTAFADDSVRNRLHALPGSAPPKPGMVRDPGHGIAIEVEVWPLPARECGWFVAGIPSPRGIGQVELETGEWVQGLACEGCAVQGAEEISQLGGWRAHLEQKAAR